MTRNSGSPHTRPARRTIGGLAALAFSAVGLCATAVAQEPAPEPPPLSPVGHPYADPPSKKPGEQPRADPAVGKASHSSSPGGSDIVKLFGQSSPSRFFLRTNEKPGNPPDKKAESTDEWLAGLRKAAERNEKALGALDQEIRQHPDRAEAFYKRGYLRFQLARAGQKDATDGAMADLTRAVELKPDYVEARHWRGYLAAHRQEWDAAIADYSWVIEHHPEIVVALGERAETWMRQGEYDRAIADLDRAEGRLPGPPEVIWARRAWCYAAKGQHDRAIAEYTRAISASSIGSESWVYEGRAESYRAKDEIDKAMADLDSALGIDPNDTSVHFLRFGLLLEDGHYWAAAEEANRLTELVPNHPGPRFLRAMVPWMAAFDYEYDLSDVAWLATLAERTFPTSGAPRLARELASAAIAQCRKEALKALDQCVAIEPRLSCLYFLRATVNAWEGRFLPTCRDLALFVVRFHRRNYHFFVRIDDWRTGRGAFGFKEYIPRPEEAAGPKSAAADIGGQCLERGLQQLLASAFNSGW